MRRKRFSVDWVLKKMMLWGGLVLGVAMMGSYALDESHGQPVLAWQENEEQWQETVRRWLAREILQWTSQVISGDALESAGSDTVFGGKWMWRRQGLDEAGDWDPAYGEFLAEQEMRKESAYLLLFGDENSNLAGEWQLAEGAGGLNGGQLAEEAGHWSEAGMNGGVETYDGSAGLAAFSGQNVHLSHAAALTGNELTYHRYRLPVTGKTYLLEQLIDYDFLMKHFYNVHSSTTAGRDEMNAKELLSVNLALAAERTDEQGSQPAPQILIYHTHSQEAYADYGSENPDATVVGVGAYLTRLLEQKGYQVIHDTSVYDLVGGKLDRNHAYNYALDGITGILQKYPSIQVVLDVHRDGVDESLHMVSEVNGKVTAPIMFFNGMSQTPEGPIEYLQNPYKKENLAFSLQMQLDAAAYYPGLTRKIYLKGLRYNMHLRPRSALIEVGAQTNTYQEALNAMEPLAQVLHMVLSGS